MKILDPVSESGWSGLNTLRALSSPGGVVSAPRRTKKKRTRKSRVQRGDVGRTPIEHDKIEMPNTNEDATAAFVLYQFRRCCLLMSNIGRQIFWEHILESLPKSARDLKLSGEIKGMEHPEWLTQFRGSAEGGGGPPFGENFKELSAFKAGKQPAMKFPVFGSNGMRAEHGILPRFSRNNVIDLDGEFVLDPNAEHPVAIRWSHAILACAVYNRLFDKSKNKFIATYKKFPVDITGKKYVDILVNEEIPLYNGAGLTRSRSEKLGRKILDALDFEIRYVFPNGNSTWKKIIDTNKESYKGAPDMDKINTEELLTEIEKRGRIVVYANLNLSTEMCQYLTQSETIDPRSMQEYATIVYNKVNYRDERTKDKENSEPYAVNLGLLPPRVGQKRRKFNLLHPLKSPKSIKESTEYLVSKKASNEDALCITRSGSLMYVPEVNYASNSAKFDEETEEYYFIKKEETFDPMYAQNDFQDEIKWGDDKTPGFDRWKQPQQVLDADWKIGTYSYVNSDGRISTEKMDQWKPVTSAHENKYLNESIPLNLIKDANPNATSSSSDEDGDYVMSTYMRFYSLLKNVLKSTGKKLVVDKKDVVNWPVPNQQDAFATLQGIVGEKIPIDATIDIHSYLMDKIRGSNPEDFEDGPIDYYAINEDLRDGKFKLKYILDLPMFGCIKRACDDAARLDANALCENIGVKPVVEGFPLIKILSKYKSSDVVLNAAKEEKVGVGYHKKADGKYKVPPLFNIRIPTEKGEKSPYLMPHQVDADMNLQNGAKLTILDVEMGGGKTIMAIIQSLRLFAQGPAKVAIICPEYLIKNYLKDAATVCGSKLNLYPLNADVYKDQGIDNLDEIIRNAPINTIFIIPEGQFSYNKASMHIEGYRKTDEGVINVNQFAEFLRRFDWDCIVVDECHQIKAEGTLKASAISRTLTNAKKVILMTGTFVYNRIDDYPGQVGKVDPGIFGSLEEFRLSNGYAPGSPMLAPSTEVISKVKDTLAESASFISQRKKEWSYLLPKLNETYHQVRMTEAQQDIYDRETAAALEELRKDLERKRIEDMVAFSQDDSQVEFQMKIHLQKVDRYITAPTEDPEWADLLKGDDRKSPKVDKVIEILDNHFKEPAKKGESKKVLIYTEYPSSAEYTLEWIKKLAPNHYKKAILYKAQEKEEIIPRFIRDDNLQIMIGGARSLSVGYNFQFATRIIRLETVWTPGGLDQSNARIYRPDHENITDNKEIWIDWIVCKSTLDVVKSAFLIGKIIDKAKADDEEDGRYITNVRTPQPRVSLAAEDLFDPGYINTIDLGDYIGRYDSEGNVIDKGAYAEYLKESKDEMNEYKEEQRRKGIKPQNIKSAGTLKGSAMLNVPYIENQYISYQNELGLINLGDYCSDKGITIYDLLYDKGFKNEYGKALYNQPIHTQDGDGFILSFPTRRTEKNIEIGQAKSGKKVEVLFKPKGKPAYRKSYLKLATFLISNPKLLKGKSVREVRADLDGLELVDIGGPTANPIHPADDATEDQNLIDDFGDDELPFETDEAEDEDFLLNLAMINHLICLVVSPEDPDVSNNIKAFTKLGFEEYPNYIYARVRNSDILDNILIKTKKAGFKIDRELKRSLSTYKNLAFVAGNNRKLFNVRRTYKIDAREFMRESLIVNSPDLMLYPVVRDGYFYLMAWYNEKNKMTRKFFAKRGLVKDKDAVFKMAKGPLVKICKDKMEAANAILDIKKAIGKNYQFENKKDLATSWKKIKYVKNASKGIDEYDDAGNLVQENVNKISKFHEN